MILFEVFTLKYYELLTHEAGEQYVEVHYTNHLLFVDILYICFLMKLYCRNIQNTQREQDITHSLPPQKKIRKKDLKV